MTENSTALLFDILDTATQGDPDSAANNITLLNQLLTATDNDPSNISANEIGLLTEILSIITDQPPDVAANEIAVLTEILSAIQTQNPQVRENKIALLNEIAANSQSLVDALNPVTLPVAASDLVAWYPFRSGTGEDITAGDSDFGDTTDYSATVNGATFQASGGVADIQTGANSGAFDFDGVDDFLDTSAPCPVPKFTFMAFVETDTSSLSDFTTILSTRDEAVQDDIEINASDFRSEFSFNRGSGKIKAPIQSSYTHLAGSFDSGNMEFFVNGSSVGTATASIPASGNVFDIGGRPAGDNHYDGRIDGVRIYNSVLSQTQINQVFQNTKP
jgi:hypothetical protein